MSIPLWLQCTHLLMATSSRIMHHVTKLKSSQTGFLNMTMSSLYSNTPHSHQSQSNRAPLGCGGTGDSHHECAADNLQQLRNAIVSIWTKISEECLQHLVESMPWRIKSVLKANGGQPGTSKVYLIKWPVSVHRPNNSVHTHICKQKLLFWMWLIAWQH